MKFIDVNTSRINLLMLQFFVVSIMIFSPKHALSSSENIQQNLMETFYKEERLLGLTIKKECISFNVETGGCTFKKDFQIQLNRDKRPTEVTLIRTRKDRCKGYFPEGKQILFYLHEFSLLKGEVFVIKNKIRF